MIIIKRDKSKQEFDFTKIENAVKAAYKSCGKNNQVKIDEVIWTIKKNLEHLDSETTVEKIQDVVENSLMKCGEYDIAKSYIIYREEHKNARNIVQKHLDFIEKYKKSSNTADATVDDNANVRSKSVGNLNAEIKKEENILVNRGIIMRKLQELFPDFDYKQYARDLEHHIIYKHDENSSNSGPTLPYCCSISLYPFIQNGIKDLGGLSAAPKNLDSFCGMLCNLVFTIAGQFLGAVALSEALVYFVYYCKKEWGEDFYLNPEKELSVNTLRKKTIRSQIHQYWQQIVYTINQNSANRGLQAAFTNFSYFDEPFFHGMFDNFYFPDGTQPDWESLKWTQKEFMQWFNNERLRVMLPFPVESFALIYKDGKFVDEDSYKFVCEELSRGHSFFIYISDTVDSLSSCCRLKNKIQTHEFNFTNGNMGVETGSKSVISINLNRVVQDWYKQLNMNVSNRGKSGMASPEFIGSLLITERDVQNDFKLYLGEILERIYKYHKAYNEILWDMYDSNLLPVYKAGFIDLNKQYLTIGLIGTSASAEFLGYKINDNKQYQKYCQLIFDFIKTQNENHKTKTEVFNTEQVPAEGAGAKLYKYDLEDGYWTPKDINLYTSYIFRPYDPSLSPLEKIKMHGSEFIGDRLDGGASAHIMLDSHPSYEQYLKIIKYAAEVGCQYLGFNIPNSECLDCGNIVKQPITKCPKCGSAKIVYWDRIIGYMSRIDNWSAPRREEQKTRIYSHID